MNKYQIINMARDARLLACASVEIAWREMGSTEEAEMALKGHVATQLSRALAHKLVGRMVSGPTAFKGITKDQATEFGVAVVLASEDEFVEIMQAAYNEGRRAEAEWASLRPGMGK